jgi:hypothetical protein
MVESLDKELDIKLKSNSFTSLLSRYVNLLVELRAILREENPLSTHSIEKKD